MTSYTTKAAYPYPDPTDPVTDYPATANTFASYIDNLPNRNVIINGQFDIWQRGTTFTTPTNGSYTADRWRIGFDGTGGNRNVTMNANVGAPLTGGMQQWRTLVLSQAIVGTGQTSLTLSQRIENARTFAAETVTASAYIWGDTRTITVKLIQNFGTGGSPSSPVTTTLGTFAVTSVRNRMKLTGTVPTAVNKTFGTNNDDYLELVFEVGGSTTFSSLVFWGVQLEQNSTATALERRPVQQELALCQRYFEKSYAQAVNPGTGSLIGNGFFVASNALAGSTAGNVGTSGSIPFKVTKRAAPTCVSYDFDGTANAVRVYPVDAKRSGVTLFANLTDNGTVQFMGFSNASATAINAGDRIQFNWTADAEL